MATCINSSRSCLLPFYTIPIFPLLNRKIFIYLLCLYTCIYTSIYMYIQCTCTCTVSVKKKLKYVRCGTVTVLCWYALGTLMVRSWYAHGSLESSIDESVRYGTRFGLLAVGKRARMHGMHDQYVDVKTYFLVQLLLDRQ